MTIKTLYKYTRGDGGTTVTPELPPDGVMYTIMWRVIADDGMNVTHNGVDKYYVIDTEIGEGWYEVVDSTTAEGGEK